MLVAAGSYDVARHRHAAHFRNLALRAEPNLSGHSQALWFDRLDQDYDNLRAALNWLETTDSSGALDLAAALAGYWDRRNLPQEGRRHLEPALDPSFSDSPRRFTALIGLGNIAALGGDFEMAKRAVDGACRLAEGLADRSSLILADLYVAIVREIFEGNQPVELLERVVVAASQAGMKQALAQAYHFLGMNRRQAGDFESALKYHDAARSAFHELGDSFSEAYAIGAMAYELWELGQTEEALDLTEEADRIHRLFGDMRGLALRDLHRALFALTSGRNLEARGLAVKAIDVLLQVGDRLYVSEALVVLGNAELALGNTTRSPIVFGISESVCSRDPRTYKVWDENAVSRASDLLGEQFEEFRAEGRAIGWEGLPAFLDKITSQ